MLGGALGGVQIAEPGAVGHGLEAGTRNMAHPRLFDGDTWRAMWPRSRYGTGRVGMRSDTQAYMAVTCGPGYIGHDYVAHSYIGHNHTGHDQMGHNCKG